MDEKTWTLKELEKDLKESHKDFAREYYINGWNKVKAYTKTYPDSSYQAAAVSAHDLLKNPKILAYIEFLKADLEKTCNINKARQLNELAKIAYSSIAHIHDTWITLKEFDLLTDDQKDSIESTETKTVVINGDDSTKEIELVKIKLHPKIQALQTINKMQGYDAPTKTDLTTKGESLNDMSKQPTDELIKRANAIKTINDAKA